MKIENMAVRTRSRLMLAVALAWIGFSSASARSQTVSKSKRQLEHLIYSVKGADLFRAHCAACHGSDGTGSGPLASALKSKVADLTVIAQNNGGQFPTKRVQATILGDEVVTSHGSQEMPIWGPIFHQIEADQDFGNVRVENLVKYLQSIQKK